PCRVADTRNPSGTFGGPSLAAGQARTFPIRSSSCAASISANVGAYSCNITVVPPGGGTFPGNVNQAGALGFLTAGPTPIPSPPNFSTLNSYLGTVVAN